MILNYNNFCTELLKAGFSMGGGSDDSIFSIINWGWNEAAPYETPIAWHTGNPETDPWEWRIRVLNERDDIAYSKVFFKKSGYITKEWYPYFLAARRGNRHFNEEYASGKMSHFAKRIYEVVAEAGRLSLDEIKREAGFSREDKSKFDSALTELQMKLYLTMCGSQQKISLKGEEYGWASTVFCTVENFWAGRSPNGELLAHAAQLNERNAINAINAITKRVLELNPAAQEKKILKFIRG